MPPVHSNQDTTESSSSAGADTMSPRAMELISVQVLTRHGARTPYCAAPQYLPEVHYDDGELTQPEYTKRVSLRLVDDSGLAVNPEWVRERNGTHGRLTANGARQHYALGKRLRLRYGKFLGAVTSSGGAGSGEVILYSSKVQRTLDSLRSLLSGE